ncbi:hypothetical protein NLX71_14075 [Paenibacillus sp. MZ04-78.2]|uniref:DUF6630 family protein n=1 Tax=Paenibacillus sp. MZ04-78.2 TaxID=2962034 RepID=UPI0020B69E57|nr:hypothetical protein [Paenibacillus sp. MZ04-78.2]MCP3774423.1 hypothetical protein [Paenibacillus sp. MZ04-78.2]
MSGRDIVQLIFEDRKDVEAILGNPEAFDIHECILKYGLSTKKILYLDYKGEQYQEIVNYILDYEFIHNLELASQDELEELGDFQYDYLPEKIRETNKIISQKGYGLFSYPTSGDFYALFIAKLENKTKLLQVNLLHDERIPSKERYIQYYD